MSAFNRLPAEWCNNSCCCPKEAKGRQATEFEFVESLRKDHDASVVQKKFDNWLQATSQQSRSLQHFHALVELLKVKQIHIQTVDTRITAFYIILKYGLINLHSSKILQICQTLDLKRPLKELQKFDNRCPGCVAPEFYNYIVHSNTKNMTAWEAYTSQQRLLSSKTNLEKQDLCIDLHQLESLRLDRSSEANEVSQAVDQFMTNVVKHLNRTLSLKCASNLMALVLLKTPDHFIQMNLTTRSRLESGQILCQSEKNITVYIVYAFVIVLIILSRRIMTVCNLLQQLTSACVTSSPKH